ncbi:MAG: MBL fold metallo-hydrolase [Propionicimonas sp.]
MTAVPLTGTVWLVGSGDPASPAFTSGYDANLYLIRRGGAAYLVDVGSGLGTQAWLANIRSVLPLEEIEAAVITHYHGDHAAGAAAAGSAGLRLLATEATAAALRQGDEIATSLAVAREAGVYPADLRLEPTEVGVLDSAVRSLPGGELTVIGAPGHCDGHVVVVLDEQDSEGDTRSLFSGDVIFAGGRVSMQALADCRLDRYASTVIALDRLRADRLFPGHGEAVMDRAWSDIGRAADAFRSLVPPPNLLVAESFRDEARRPGTHTERPESPPS